MSVASKIDLDQIPKVSIERKARKDILDQLKFYISTKIFYLIVKKNRPDIFTKSESTRYLYKPEEQKDIRESESSVDSIRGNDNNKQKSELNMVLYKEQWSYVYDVVLSQIYNRSDMLSLNREYHTVKPDEWSPTVQSIMLELKLIFENFKIEAENFDCGDHDNLKFTPRTAKKLIDCCESIPSWFSVMIPAFKYGNISATSATPEDLFDDLKTKVFKHKTLPTRIDQFLKTLLNSTVDLMNTEKSTLGASKSEIDYNNYLVDKKGCEIPKKKTSGYIFKAYDGVKYNTEKNSIGLNLKNEISHAYGIWSGLGRETTKTENVLQINDSSEKKKSAFMDILINGNSGVLDPVEISGLSYDLSNTCAFDSVVQLICGSYVDSERYSEYVDRESKRDDFFELVSSAAKNGFDADAYRKRFIILIRILWPFSARRGRSMRLRDFDCTCTVDFMVRKIFANYPSLLTVETCPDCRHTRRLNIPTISVETENLRFLDDALLSASLQSPETCAKCTTGSIELTVEYGKQIFVELYHVPRVEQEPGGDVNSDVTSVALRDIPRTMAVEQQTYGLRGYINFIPPHSNDLHAVGHYIAYCWRQATGEWEEYDDLSLAPRTIRPDSIATNCQILVYSI